MASKHKFYVKTPTYKFIAVCLGYGIICGLTFPLIISSTFLRKINLIYEAEGLFGAAFLLVYALTMIAVAFAHRFPHRKRTSHVLAASLVGLFVGNLTLQLVSIGFLHQHHAFTVIAACCIGSGLALSEFVWLKTISYLHKREGISIGRAISGSFMCGSIVAIAILALPHNIVTFFGLFIPFLSGAFYKSILLADGRQERIRPCHAKERALVSKAIIYLALVSFTFGAVSQAFAASTISNLLIVSMQALGGIAAAALYMHTKGNEKEEGGLTVSDMYQGVFPIVSIGLISFPFFASSYYGPISSFLIFAAFYLSSMRIRSIICQQSVFRESSAWFSLGIALGLSSLSTLVGSFFSAWIIAHDASAESLLFIALISLFALTLSPVLVTCIEKRSLSRTTSKPIDTQIPNRSENNFLDRFVEEHGLTARESEVLAMIRLGRTRNYVANELNLSPNTVKGYIRNIYQKCDVSDKQELIDKLEAYQASLEE